MSNVLEDSQDMPEHSRALALPKQLSLDKKRLLWLFWAAIVGLLVVAVIARLYHLNQPFDRDGYDEGVYWQSLRAMLTGESLYHTIFYSQPPMFLFSIFPGFALFGGTLWAARFGVVLVSFFGFLGAGLLGKALAGRLGVVLALLLLVVDARYLAESQTLQAEAPSVALTFLAVGFAFLWWKKPDGWRGACWAALSGMTLALSILCKLLCVSTVVPIVLLLAARVWQISRKQPGTSRRSWLPVLAGVVAGLLTALVVVFPFLGTFSDFWAGVVTFHQAAALADPGTPLRNFDLMEPVLFSFLALAALFGTFAACVRRDWRVLPLLAWLLVTLGLLVRQYPLFDHHLIIIEPPFIALALLGVADPTSASYQSLLSRLRLKIPVSSILLLGILLILIASTANVSRDLHYYQAATGNTTSTYTQKTLQAASDLRQAITPDEWVITDGQFIAGLADRNTPPSLVDTSSVRITSGYVTLAQLEQAATNPRVHAVLFFGNRFEVLPQTAGFHAWVALHFHLLKTYGSGEELWVR
jgi:4-amino-4-deoxy-L-arabinose transferase-like glycosyltransferase